MCQPSPAYRTHRCANPHHSLTASPKYGTSLQQGGEKTRVFVTPAYRIMHKNHVQILFIFVLGKDEVGSSNLPNSSMKKPETMRFSGFFALPKQNRPVSRKPPQNRCRPARANEKSLRMQALLRLSVIWAGRRAARRGG